MTTDNQEDLMTIGGHPWPQVVRWLLALLVLYTIGSVFISNPFSLFVDRTTPIDYSRAMYFHGMAVGLAGITSLILAEVFTLTKTCRKVILFCTVAAVLIGVTGGAVNRSMEETKLFIWYQIFSFFALDAILITLTYGLLTTKDTALRGTRAWYLVLAAVITGLIGALIGDLAGFILDFGKWPGIQVWYANLIGYSFQDWQDNLLRSHSDLIVVAVIGLLLSVIDWKYGRHLEGTAARVQAFGEWLAIAGLAILTVIMVVNAFGGVNCQIPHIFTEKGFYAPRGTSVAGIDLGDFTIGSLFFPGGILVLGAILFGKKAAGFSLSAASKRTLAGLFITWCSILVTVGGMGFLEEYRADLYNSAKDVVLGNFGFAFKMLHVDVSLMMLPALMLVMILSQHFLKDAVNKTVQTLLLVSVILCSIGCFVYMVVNPSLLGPGYWVIAAGFVFVIAAMVMFFKKSGAQLEESFRKESVK